MKPLDKIINELKNSTEKENEIKSVKVDWNIHSNGIKAIAETMVKGYEFNEDNKEVFRLLLQYFTGNIEFEKKFPNGLNKGILLLGPVGTGKSVIFNIFKQYTMNVLRVNSYQCYTSSEIIDKANTEGVDYLNKFSEEKTILNKEPRPARIYIDDIASRTENVKNFGTDINVIEQFLSIRYNVFQRYGVITHMSTNKYRKELKTIYDERIIDRMKEMFNIIELKGKSFRK